MSDCSQTFILTQGNQGPPGADGANGISSIATLTDQFIMPGEGATAIATVDDSRGFNLGATVFMQNAGTFSVSAIPDVNTMVLLNLEDIPSGLYPDNVAPGTIIPAMNTIIPGGIQGPSGGTTAVIQLGNGPPTGVTPSTPPVYIDVFTAGGPFFYWNILGNWYVH